MAKKNRRSLKNTFREGAQPTADAFVDLVDSALNVVDDGFDKSDEDGFKVAQIGHDGRLMSFYENLSVRQASWSLRLAPGGGQLLIVKNREIKSDKSNHSDSKIHVSQSLKLIPAEIDIQVLGNPKILSKPVNEEI